VVHDRRWVEPVELRLRLDERILAEVSTDTCERGSVRFAHLSVFRERQNQAANVQQGDVRAVANPTMDYRGGCPFGSFDLHDSGL
jgi:hypothetical protein